MPRRTLILCLASLLAAVHGFARQARTSDRAEPSIDVRSSSAVGDGRSDDTELIAAAAGSCAQNGGLLYLPYTRAAYTTTKSVELPANCDLKIDGVLKATAPMEAVVTVGANGTAYRHRIFGLGSIDSANLAKRHIALANYGHFEITGITLLNGASIAGIDIGPQGSKGGYEAYIHDINLFVPHGVARIPASAGIWADKGTDSSVYNIAIVGYDIGVRNSIHNNQPFANIHVWGFGPNPGWNNVSNLPSVCFDDVAGDAQWSSDECDTPTLIGLEAHGYNDQITGFSCYNNEIWGTDNVVNCIQFDLPKPYASVMNSIFQGKKSHRLASDVAVASDNYSQIEMLGNSTIANVVKSRSMTAHFSNATVEGTLNLGVPLRFSGKADRVFGTNEMGCLDGWDHLPCTVAKLLPKTMTLPNSLSPTTAFTTVASTGVYQVIVTFRSLGGATGGTATPMAVVGQLSVPGAAASMTSAGADGISTASVTNDEGPGVGLGYALNVSNPGGAPRYVISAEVVRVQ
ncbi:MAG TPA: hypothetical protein VI320_11255 [Terracidiphilus sp.]|jgi:hypothetical protein